MFELSKITMKTVDYDTAKLYIEKNHYSHKIPQAVKYRFGFYYEDQLVGCCIYSVPANCHCISCLFDNESQQICIELSRFYGEDITCKNFESYCISKTFESLKNKYDLILSYADSYFKHVGTIYQALNFLYLGKTAPEIRYFYNNQLITRRALGRGKTTEKEDKEKLLNLGAKQIKMPGKYKYIYFICNRRRKKELLKKLKCKVLPYPKET
jgi:hypothetical protein